MTNTSPRLSFGETTLDGQRAHWWLYANPGDPIDVSDPCTSRPPMLSNCVDALGEKLLNPDMTFVDIHDNTKNLLISAARTRTRIKGRVAVSESFHDRGHGEMGEIVSTGLNYHSNMGVDE